MENKTEFSERETMTIIGCAVGVGLIVSGATMAYLGYVRGMGASLCGSLGVFPIGSALGALIGLIVVRVFK